MVYRPKVRTAGALASTIVMVGLVLSLVGDARAQAGPSDVDIILIAQLEDAAGWVALHQEILTTGAHATKPLRANLPAATGGGRSVDIERPKVSVEIVVANGRTLFKVGITGKVIGAAVFAAVAPFEYAALEIQAGAVRNELTLQYGLSAVAARLLELYITRN